MQDKPLLYIDIDGVLSVWGFDANARPPGAFASIDGIPHLLSSAAASNLLAVLPAFEPVWASGWEEKADEHLPSALGVPAGLPHLHFPDGPSPRNKRAAIDAHSSGRPAAWIDDAIDRGCQAWARLRPAPTLLVRTDPAAGLTGDGVEVLLDWAAALR